MQKQVDVIVCCWNALDFTKMCLKSILEKTENFNLVIVDNGSDLDTQEYLTNFTTEHDNVYLIRHEKNLGCVGGMNSGFIYALENLKSPVIASITTDTICPTGWFQSMNALLKDDVAMVGPISNAVAGRQSVQYNNQKYNVEYTDYLMGFFYIVKSSAVEQLILLDGFYMDDLFNFGSADDLDICLRLRKMGYKLIIDRKVYVHHFLSKSLSNLADEKKITLNDLHGKYFQIFQKKHGLDKIPPQREPFVLIGVPMASDQLHEKFWLSSMSAERPFKHCLETMPREMPDSARNRLAQMALDYGCTHLMVLDDDMVYDDQMLFVKLLQANADIIGVRAYTRRPPHFPCVFYQLETGFYKEIDFECTGIREVAAIGMGVTLISTEVFRKMEKPWFEFHKVSVLGHDLAGFGEDIYFCRKARDLGFKVYCQTDIEVGHIGANKIIQKKDYKK